MDYILMPDEMRRADETQQNDFLVDGLVLMERAALESYYVCLEEKLDLKKVLIVCGTGNNGGDGLALARIMKNKGVDVSVCIVSSKNPVKGTESFEKEYAAYCKCNGSFVLSVKSDGYTLVVDALFGNSLNRKVEGCYEEAIRKINDLRSAYTKILAMDIPSGIHPGTGEIMGTAVMADVTVSFGFYRVGQLLYPGADYCGKLILRDVGISKEAVLQKPRFQSLTEEEIRFPVRPSYSNKGTFGKLLLVAGSEGACGAAILAGLSAMRSGLGMLKIVTSVKNREALLSVLPEAMYLFYDDGSYDREELLRSVRWSDCVAIGPGLSDSDIAKVLVHEILCQDMVPVVADADALNVLAQNPHWLLEKKQQLVITPHLGEMSRLTGLPVADIAQHLPDTASDFAIHYNLTCVLKDARTVISDPYGQLYINRTGNSGMAVAGSGDVLTGIIAALIAGGSDVTQASVLGCALHGKSGDKGSFLMSEQELLARDIIRYLE